MNERCGFRFQDNGQAMWFFTIDRPIYEYQCQAVYNELEQEVDRRLLKPRSKQARISKKWFHELIDLDQDGYGSFRLTFDTDLAKFSDAELTAFNEDLTDLIAYTCIVENIRLWISIEENLEDLVENEDAESLMLWYIDAVLDSGYRLNQRDVEEMFGKYIDPKEISKDFLMRNLRGENVVLAEGKVELEV